MRITTLALVAGLTFGAYGGAKAQDETAAPPPPKPVKLMTVEAVERGLVRRFFGNVVARRTVDLAFQVSGQILEFPAVEGETVPEGELIAKLDQTPFELAVEQSELQKVQADRTFERLNQLVSSSAVSRVNLEDAETQASLADVSLRNAQNNLDHATLTAPFDALVASRSVGNFTTISAGTPVVRLHDMSELRIEIDVPELLFQRAGADANVAITAKFPFDERVFPLEVREFNAETSQFGQSFRLTFGMAPPDGLSILPGSSVTVTARLIEDGAQIIIPPSAVATAADGATSVVVFTPGEGDTGTVAVQSVVLRALDTGLFAVDEGLDGGEEIIAAGVSAVKDGETVRRFTGFSN